MEAQKAVDLERLSQRWAQRWPDCRPIGHELRDCSRETWVRFHSLPQSKRYAEDEAEYREILRRHHAILSEMRDLSPSNVNDDKLLVFTSAWSDSSEPVRRAGPLNDVAPAEALWTSILADQDGEEEFWTHVYVSRVGVASQNLDALLRLVADDETGGVIVSDYELDWLYHPYDGGGDVIAPTVQVRDAMRARHADWLSTHPLGL